jgi:hypothetical protein
MEGGKRASVDLRLNRESNLAAPSTTGPGASLVERSNAQPAPTSAGTSSSARTVIGWSLLGAGIATAGVGGVLLFTAKDCAPMPGFECTHQAPSRVPGWTLLASGLAASAAGAIVLVTRPTSQTEIAVGLAGVFVRGTL